MDTSGVFADPTARRTLTYGLVMMITVAAFEALGTATVMPAVKEDLGGVALYGFAFSAYLLSALVGIAFAGEQADRHGPARPYAVGLILFAAGLAIAGLAPAMWVFVIGRAVQGLGAGVIPPVAYVTVGRAYPEEARPRILALFATAWVLPGLIGPGLSGAAAEYLTWRIVFLGILPLVLAAALLTLPALRKIGPPADAPAHRDSRIPAAVVLAIGAGLVLGAPATGSPWLSPLLMVPGIVLVVPSLRKLMPKGTFRAARGLPSVVLGVGALNLAFFGADAFVPLMLTEVRGQSTVMAGLVVTSATLSWTAGSWLVERRAQHTDRRVLARIGFSLLCVGAVALLPVLSSTVPVVWTLLAWGVAGLGIGMAYPSFSLIILATAAEAEVGAVTASTKLAESLSAATGAGVAGALVAVGDAGGWLPGSLAVAFALMAAVAMGGALLTDRVPGGTSTAEGVPEAVAAGAK